MIEWGFIEVPISEDAKGHMILKNGKTWGGAVFAIGHPEISLIVEALNFFERTKEKGFFEACSDQHFDIVFQSAPRRTRRTTTKGKSRAK